MWTLDKVDVSPPPVRTTRLLQTWRNESLYAFVVSANGTHLRAVIDGIPLGSSIIDIGCGNGLWMRRAAMRGTVVGIDRSLPMLRAATGSSAAQALACADARLLPLRDRSADVVLMLWLLHHLADKTVAVSEAQRILRSGGQLIAATSEASETGPHADLIREAFTRVLGRDCDRWLEPLDFHVDNGRHVLRQHFEAVTVHHSSINFELDDPEPLVNYLDSGRAPIEAELGSDLPWLDILTTTRTLVSAHIRSHGSLRFSRRSATFVAR